MKRKDETELKKDDALDGIALSAGNEICGTTGVHGLDVQTMRRPWDILHPRPRPCQAFRGPAARYPAQRRGRDRGAAVPRVGVLVRCGW